MVESGPSESKAGELKIKIKIKLARPKRHKLKQRKPNAGRKTAEEEEEWESTDLLNQHISIGGLIFYQDNLKS